ncbi:MAG: hypothetical protein ACREFP_02915 [Acetobacteraceae bacterium]
MQLERGGRKNRGRLVHFLAAEVAGFEEDAPIVVAADGGERITIDGGIQHGAAISAGIAGKVGTATSQPEPERRPRAHGGGRALIGRGHPTTRWGRHGGLRIA